MRSISTPAALSGVALLASIAMPGCTETSPEAPATPATPAVAPVNESVAAPPAESPDSQPTDTAASDTPLSVQPGDGQISPPAATESELPEGTWSASTATLAGTPFPDAVTKSISLAIARETYEVLVGGQPDRGTCVTDLTETPHRMTITGTEGPNVGKTMLAIFDFPATDQLRVCYDMTGAAFPDSFESTAENGRFLVTYSRTASEPVADAPVK